MELVPIKDGIGIEVKGIDVTKNLSDSDYEAMYQAWVDNCILLIRNQHVSTEQHVEFSKRFGRLVSYTRPKFSESEEPEVLVLSNIKKDGQYIGSPFSGRVWHTDGHYLTDPPAGSWMHAIQVTPTGGQTWFANMMAAYDALPKTVKEKIADLKVIISRLQSRPYNYPNRSSPTEAEKKEWVAIAHPLVRTHEINGRKALYAGGNVPWRIVDMPKVQSDPLITYLQEFSTQERFTYCHQWAPGDLLLWDNRSSLHKATKYDEENDIRLMHRTTIASRASNLCVGDALSHEAWA